MQKRVGSEAFSLSKYDLKKVGIGAAIAAAGAALAWVSDWSESVDLGDGKLIIAAVIGTLLNLLRKASTDTTKIEQKL